jgi:lipoprotein-anchoring transpeptidase ErfK/SrfK
MTAMRRALVSLVVAVLVSGTGIAAAPSALALSAPEHASTAQTPARHAAAVTTTATSPKAVARRPVPAGSGSGRRIVYSEKVPQHIWLVNADGSVERDFAASGRANWPRTGTFRVFSKSPQSNNARYGVTFRWMVRFTIGHSSAIGFHSIPRYYNGKPMQTVAQLGQPVGRGGCPHSADANAKFLYSWARIGTKVVVVR